MSIGQLQSWKEAVQEWLNAELKIFYSGKLKCGAGEGWRRSVGPIM
jgi:hypothetical protein